jgi:hypothetical protein
MDVNKFFAGDEPIHVDTLAAIAKAVKATHIVIALDEDLPLPAYCPSCVELCRSKDEAEAYEKRFSRAGHVRVVELM